MMRGRTLASSLLLGILTTSCNAVLGLDDRELAGDGAVVSALDASDETISEDAAAGEDAEDDVAAEVSVIDGGGADAADATMSGSDATTSETTIPDTAKSDTAKSDTAVADTFVAPQDTGPFDTGTTGPIDTGAPDTGSVTPDVGPCDGGPVNACGGCNALFAAPGEACGCNRVYRCIGTALACDGECPFNRICCETTGLCHSPTCTSCCSEIEP